MIGRLCPKRGGNEFAYTDRRHIKYIIHYKMCNN